MSISERANGATNAILAVLQATPAEAERRQIVKIIEQALVNTTLAANESCTHAVMECCSPDLDTAHKVADEIRRRQAAVLANLSSLR